MCTRSGFNTADAAASLQPGNFVIFSEESIQKRRQRLSHVWWVGHAELFAFLLLFFHHVGWIEGFTHELLQCRVRFLQCHASNFTTSARYFLETRQNISLRLPLCQSNRGVGEYDFLIRYSCINLTFFSDLVDAREACNPNATCQCFHCQLSTTGQASHTSCCQWIGCL